jgi:hypothetical protein
MKRLPAALRKGMTYDRGSEMACHPELARRLKPWSNGQAEGQISRLKTLKRAMYGRAGPELLPARMLPFRHTN